LLQFTGLDDDNNPVYERWRIGVYVTPYGNNLDMGDGWTWVYDVTDFLPLLKDWVLLRDNNGQELLDLKFAFIEGQPVRPVVDIKKVWDSEGYGDPCCWGGYPIKNFDNLVTDTTFTLTAQEKQVKLRTCVTGHYYGDGNNCGEFCPNIHKVLANGQVLRQWEILEACGEIPLYPQGGTWLYDRAGWCPGIPGTIREFELTNYIQNNAINFDYDVTYDPYNGVYRIYAFLVTYGDINNQNDVEALSILRPTDNLLYSRDNPSTFKPIIVIRNIGSNNLTSVNIKYGLEGYGEFTETWTGNLGFMENDTIMLSNLLNWDEVEGNTANFYYSLTSPNGNDDPTAFNNTSRSTCIKPHVVVGNKIRFVFKTNNNPRETSWVLTNALNEVIYEAKVDTLGQNKTYTHNWTLPNGSYCVALYDSHGDGLYYWANTGAGTGYARLSYFNQNDVAIQFYNFEREFGNYIKYYFAINEFSTSSDVTESIVNKNIVCYPNPTNDVVFLDMSNIDNRNLTVEIIDISGKLLVNKAVARFSMNKVDIKHLNNGIYSLIVKSYNKQIFQTKIVKQD
jgi:hypothetical protein